MVEEVADAAAMPCRPGRWRQGANSTSTGTAGMAMNVPVKRDCTAALSLAFCCCKAAAGGGGHGDGVVCGGCCGCEL